MLNSSAEQLTLQTIGEDGAGGGGNRAAEDDESSGGGRESGAEGSDGGSGGNSGVGRARGRAPFVLLLKKATDLVLQPFQALQVCCWCTPFFTQHYSWSVLGMRYDSLIFPFLKKLNLSDPSCF